METCGHVLGAARCLTLRQAHSNVIDRVFTTLSYAPPLKSMVFVYAQGPDANGLGKWLESDAARTPSDSNTTPYLGAQLSNFL